MRTAVSGVLVVDKPRGVSSHDVVQIARRALHTREVGHAGTLDPMATGVLVLGVGEGTKLLRYLTEADKQYVATLQLGSSTDSLDADGAVTERAAVPEQLTVDTVVAAAARFSGAHLQVAPAVSAIKRDGVALYERVRRGEVVEPPERAVVLHDLDVLEVGASEVVLRLRVGKGFYVRSFGRDLALALGTVGHLSALRREESGGFSADNAVEVALLLAARTDEQERARVLQCLLPLTAALAGSPQVTVDDSGAQDAYHGRPIAAERVIAGVLPDAEVEPVLVLDAAGEPLVLARARGGRLEVVRGLRFSRAGR